MQDFREGEGGSSYWEAVQLLTAYTFKRLVPCTASGAGGAFERRLGQLRLVPLQQVTEFSKDLAVTAAGNTDRALRPPQPPGRDRFPQIPDAGLHRVPGFLAVRAADHRRQRRRDARYFNANENQRW